MKKDMNEDYSSRKFIVAIICLILNTIAFFIGKVAAIDWEIFMLVCIFGYGALNLVDKLLAIRAGGLKQ
jgi:hypothetical protein